MIISLLVSSSAFACRVDVRGTGYAMIAVNGWQSGDVCNIKEFPKQWNSMLGIHQGYSRAFHWVWEDKQYGYAMFQIGADGKGRVVFHFSNGKQFDGDTFTAAVEFLDKDKKSIGYVSVIRGVNARRTGDIVQTLADTPDFWNRVHFLKFFHGRHQKQDDQKNWKVVFEALKKACEATVCGGGGSQPTSPTTPAAAARAKAVIEMPLARGRIQP